MFAFSHSGSKSIGRMIDTNYTLLAETQKESERSPLARRAVQQNALIKAKLPVFYRSKLWHVLPVFYVCSRETESCQLSHGTGLRSISRDHDIYLWMD